MVEVSRRVGRLDAIEHAVNVSPQHRHRAVPGGPQHLLKFAVVHLDRVEVGAVVRQVKQRGAGGLDHPLAGREKSRLL